MFVQSHVSSESTTIVGEMQDMFSVIPKKIIFSLSKLYYGKLPKRTKSFFQDFSYS